MSTLGLALANGEDIWAAINELRRVQHAQGKEIAVNESQVIDLREDINGLGKKVENLNSNCATKKDVQAFEGRLDKMVANTRWVVAIAVPLVSALIGALLRGGT